MSGNRKRLGLALLSALAIFLVVKTVLWVNSGCPVGFALRKAALGVRGRTVFASSDHLLRKLVVHTRKASATLDIEGRKVDVSGDQEVIDEGRTITVPSASKVVTIAEKGDALIVSADGEKVAEVGR